MERQSSCWMLSIFYGLVFSIAVAADQFSKQYFKSFLSDHGPVSVLPFFSLRLELNHGCAFSLFHEHGQQTRLALCLVSLVVVIAFLALAIYRIRSGLSAMGEILLIAGGFSNFIDRLFFGVVIDFLHFYVAWFHWPTFNFADCFVVIGAALIAKRILK